MVGNEAGMRENRNAHKFLVGKHEGKRLLARLELEDTVHYYKYINDLHMSTCFSLIGHLQ
jgi:hypothetical protein